MKSQEHGIQMGESGGFILLHFRVSIGPVKHSRLFYLKDSTGKVLNTDSDLMNSLFTLSGVFVPVHSSLLESL